jgi:hypothetical protein
MTRDERRQRGHLFYFSPEDTLLRGEVYGK